MTLSLLLCGLTAMESDAAQRALGAAVALLLILFTGSNYLTINEVFYKSAAGFCFVFS